MKLKLSTLVCSEKKEALHKSLIESYANLNEIVSGKRLFGGFTSDCGLDKKFYMNPKNYPPLKINFTESDIQAIARFAKMDAKELVDQAKTPLEFLAIAGLWKNADLVKLRHIAGGIAEGGAAGKFNQLKKQAPVFRQFGRHLSRPDCEPIADQHTLRAYRYQLGENLGDPRHKKDTVTSQEVEDYVKWVHKLIRNFSQQNSAAQEIKNRMYDFDQSMFALGKATKSLITSLSKN